MSIKTFVWKLASPYDAYVSHVSRLENSLSEIRFLVQRALGYEATLQGSVRLVPGSDDPAARAARFREQIGQAAVDMTDEQFEEFISHLGGGEVGAVESDRARAVGRLTAVTDSIERYLGQAAVELSVLEERDYDPARSGVGRELRNNNLEPRTLAEYRHLLRDLAAQVGKSVA